MNILTIAFQQTRFVSNSPIWNIWQRLSQTFHNTCCYDTEEHRWHTKCKKLYVIPASELPSQPMPRGPVWGQLHCKMFQWLCKYIGIISGPIKPVIVHWRHIYCKNIEFIELPQHFSWKTRRPLYHLVYTIAGADLAMWATGRAAGMGPLIRCANLRVAHAPECRERFPRHRLKKETSS